MAPAASAGASAPAAVTASRALAGGGCRVLGGRRLLGRSLPGAGPLRRGLAGGGLLGGRLPVRGLLGRRLLLRRGGPLARSVVVGVVSVLGRGLGVVDGFVDHLGQALVAALLGR